MLPPGAYQNFDFEPDTSIQFGQLNSRTTAQRPCNSTNTSELEDFDQNGVILPFSVSNPQVCLTLVRFFCCLAPSQPFSQESVLSPGAKPQNTAPMLQQAAPSVRIAGSEAFIHQYNTEKMLNLLDGSGQFAKLQINEDKEEEV